MSSACRFGVLEGGNIGVYKYKGGLVEDVTFHDNICQGCPCNLCHLGFLEVFVSLCRNVIYTFMTMLILVYGVRTCMCKTKQKCKVRCALCMLGVVSGVVCVCNV